MYCSPGPGRRQGGVGAGAQRVVPPVLLAVQACYCRPLAELQERAEPEPTAKGGAEGGMVKVLGSCLIAMDMTDALINTAMGPRSRCVTCPAPTGAGGR